MNKSDRQNEDNLYIVEHGGSTESKEVKLIKRILHEDLGILIQARKKSIKIDRW